MDRRGTGSAKKGKGGRMLQLGCALIMQAIHLLAQQIQETDSRRGVLEAEAMELKPLQYLGSQRELNRLVRVRHTLQDKWDTAMSELAICRSAHPAHHPPNAQGETHDTGDQHQTTDYADH